jgi:uncharacterized caspase-like protein
MLHSFAILAQSSKMTETSLTMYDGKRKALLIGNKNYQFYRPLSNTERDVDAMSKVLKNLGFEVSSYKNLDYQATVIALRKFKETLSPNDVALLYYSGHGIGSNTQSYLLPVDASIKCSDELEVFVPLSLNKIIKDLELKQLRNSFVFLDACRNLPNLSACSNSKDAQDPKGLVMPKTNPKGNLIVFATGEGKTADDDTYDKTNSLFTAELLKNLQTPNVGIRTILDNVINAVEERSNGKQIPQKLEDLRGDFVFAITQEEQEKLRIDEDEKETIRKKLKEDKEKLRSEIEEKKKLEEEQEKSRIEIEERKKLEEEQEKSRIEIEERKKLNEEQEKLRISTEESKKLEEEQEKLKILEGEKKEQVRKFETKLHDSKIRREREILDSLEIEKFVNSFTQNPISYTNNLLVSSRDWKVNAKFVMFYKDKFLEKKWRIPTVNEMKDIINPSSFRKYFSRIEVNNNWESPTANFLCVDKNSNLVILNTKRSGGSASPENFDFTVNKYYMDIQVIVKFVKDK